MSISEKNSKPPVIVVYRVSERAKTFKMAVFRNHIVDDIITTDKRKPLLPYEYVFDEVCVGESCIATYLKKYKLKKFDNIE